MNSGKFPPTQMTPKKVPVNDLERAMLALAKSRAALPQLLRELGTGEREVELESGMLAPFAQLTDAEGPYVPVS